MKTQISNLINGAKNVIRDEEHEKYITAKQAATHVGYAGTYAKERQEISERVYHENSDTLHINVRGVELTLQIHKSMSGKSWYWSVSLTDKQFQQICHTSIGVGENLRSYELEINYDCRVYVQTFNRKNERRIWREGYTHYIDEAFVTIL
ncbi:MAG TPA: hypothetical protein DEB74_12415 [Lachnospiraceae bacterium]|nr:hypothetical protein [Lachnospiraceae bacterium]